MHESLTIIGFAILLGIGGMLISQQIKIPAIAGYVIIGVIFGSSVFNVFTPEVLTQIGVINDLALAIIAFIIGGELRWNSLMSLGRMAFIIVIFEAAAAFFLVAIGMQMFFHNPALSLVLGAIAASTAPAATMMVVEEMKARGTFTKTLMAVVAIDDGIALIIYSIAAVFAKSFLIEAESLSFMAGMAHAGRELVGSIGLGAVAGAFIIPSMRRSNKQENSFLMMAGVSLLITGIARQHHLSVLLVNMVFGIVLTNFSPLNSNKVFGILKKASAPILVAFFITAGAQLRIDQISQIWLYGIIYLICYFIGKIGGASLGAWVARAPTAIQKYIGFGLIPQLGVAVGLVLAVSKDFSQIGPAGEEVAQIIRNLILTTCLVTEVVGPLLTRYALQSSGDCGSKG